MGHRWIVPFLCLTGLVGCSGYDSDPRPPRIVSKGPALVVSSLGAPPEPRPKADLPPVPGDVPTEWVPPAAIERQWKAIVVHHSGTANGNTEVFDRWHRERQWDGVGYDFVIGNGTESGDGQVEVTYRWRQQKVGAHCKTPSNWANEEAVGICVVGNFDQTVPTERQMQALIKLCRFLTERYAIPTIRVYGHEATPGANETDCPGALFPLDRLYTALDSPSASLPATLGQ